MAKNLTPIGLEPKKNDTDGLPENPKESPTKEKNLTPISEESKKKKGSTDGLPVNPQPELYI
jgi:hypothetical protein